MLHTTTRGDGGRGVVFVHGFLGSGRNLSTLARSWTEAAPELKALLVDLPGHGRSPPLGAEDTLKTMANAVLAATSLHFPNDPVDWVGHSLGGRVALAARQQAPEQVGTIYLLDITPSAIPVASTDTILESLCALPEQTSSKEDMRAQLENRGVSRPLAEWLLMSGRSTAAGFRWSIDRSRLQEFHSRHRNVDLWDAVRPSPATFCIRGGLSSYVNPDDIRQFRELGVEVLTVEEAGHFLHSEQPKGVLRALQKAYASTVEDKTNI